MLVFVVIEIVPFSQPVVIGVYSDDYKAADVLNCFRYIKIFEVDR